MVEVVDKHYYCLVFPLQMIISADTDCDLDCLGRLATTSPSIISQDKRSRTSLMMSDYYRHHILTVQQYKRKKYYFRATSAEVM